MLTKEKLMLFCDFDNGIERINRPWSKGNFTYSTDGYIIVRVDRDPEFGEKENAPDAEKLYNRNPSPLEWFGIPELLELKFCICQKCGGKKQIEEAVFETTEINGCNFQNKYLRFLKELPNCKISPINKDNPAWFKFDGGDGLLMPCLK